LPDDLQAKRKEKAMSMLPYLRAAQNDDWQHLMTGDESWFSLHPALLRLWTLSRDDLVTKPKLNIQSKIVMFTIMWNPTGFHVVDQLPNQKKMNGHYFVTNILTPLEKSIFPEARAPYEKPLIVHVDNASIYTSQVSTKWLDQQNIVCVPPPPYSPDSAPSDFCLFPTMKEKLQPIALRD
jgi:hypothetical protein